MKCWKCGKDLPEPTWGKIAFRETCGFCSASLHCCKNCRFYKPGLPNDCMVPGTDFIPDREAMNLCEEFKLSDKSPEKPKDPKEARDKFNRLFGDERDQKDKKD